MDEPDGAWSIAVKDRQVALNVTVQAMPDQSLTKTWWYWMDSMRAFKVDVNNFNNVHFEFRTKF